MGALIRSEPISMQWTSESRRNIRLHPSYKLLREPLSLEPKHPDNWLPTPNQGLEFASDRGSFEGLTYYNSKLLEIGGKQLKRNLAAPG
jgi:hypothetical protein